MKKKRTGRTILIICMVLLLIAAVGFGAFKLLEWIGSQKRAAAAPPTVYLNSPKTGESYPVDQLITVHATAIGSNDIQVLELRLDGQSKGKVFNDTGIAGDFDGLFEISLTEGPHSITVRATDQESLVGQSIPIQLMGTVNKPEDGLLIHISQEGESLESIANDFGMDLDDLKALNPGLGDGALPPGTRVKLPQGGKEEEPPDPATAAPAGQPAQPAPSGPPPSGTQLIEASKAIPVVDVIGAVRRLNTPKAPDGLTATQQDCKMTLSWNDNSTNEDYFRVWFGGLGLPPRVIATVSSAEHTGPVWYQFNTPPAGIYNFWVEAGNALGSQPGEEVWIGVPGTQCEDYTSAYLYFTIDKLEVSGNYDQLYCYVSVEGAPEHRFPTEENSFFDDFVQNALWGDFFPVGMNLEAFTIPYPEDGTVDVQGECLAWSGGFLDSLGEFSTTLTANEAEFVDVQLIETPNFKIWVKVRPYGWEQPREDDSTYTFYDPNIQPPYNLDVFDTGYAAKEGYSPDNYLTWDWNGDENGITGFTIYLNGNPINVAQPQDRSATFPMPVRCGKQLELEVAVNLPTGESFKSEKLDYRLVPCSIQAVLVFDYFHTLNTNDSYSGNCDEIETFFAVSISGADFQTRHIGVGSGFSWRYPMICHTIYSFEDIGKAIGLEEYYNWIPFQIDPFNPEITIRFQGWDYDWGSANDLIIADEIVIKDFPVYDSKGYSKELVFSGRSGFAVAYIFTEH